MMIEIENVKGFQDFLPPESLKRNSVKKIIEKYFRLYGFLPLETPVVEFDELMRSPSLPSEQEDEAISDRFRLRDRGGRNLGLRYEFTFQLARILKQNPNLKMPFRRYQIGEIFRDEPVSVGRFRQFTQCDADIIGDQSTNADIECLSLFSDILKELKIDFEIEVNNRKLLSSIIESVQISEIKGTMKELDKLDKIGEDMVKTNLRKYASSNQILTLMKLFDKPIDFFVENAFEGSKELKELFDKSTIYKVKLKFNPFLTRGFAYYTGNIFEIKVSGSKNTIAGGGRYDKTVGKLVQKDVPAVGISFGLERVSELAKISPEEYPKAIIISISQDKEAVKMVQKLRKENISCILGLDKIGKELEYANSYKIPFALFIGKEEISKGKFKLRNMSSGEEKLLSEKQIIKLLGRS